MTRIQKTESEPVVFVSTYHGQCLCGKKFVRMASEELEFQCVCGRYIDLGHWGDSEENNQ